MDQKHFHLPVALPEHKQAGTLDAQGRRLPQMVRIRTKGK
jgi:hypothetical protein